MNFTPGTEGIFLGLDEKTYRSAPGINISALKEMRLSPKHYKHGLDDTGDPSKALVIGSVAHLATLQPEILKGSYVVRPEKWDSWRSKEAQAWRDAQKVLVLTPDEEKQALSVRDAVRGHARAWRIVSAGDREVSAFRLHERTGLLMKGRADIVAMDDDGRTVIADLKTCGYGGASEEAFSQAISKFNYHQQAAWYMDLFGADEFVFIAVEKEAPFDVSLDHIDKEDVEIGRRVNEAAMQRVAECLRTGVWPGYTDNIRTVRLKAWKRQMDGGDLT